MKVEAMLAEKGDKVATTKPDATVATVAHLLKLEGIGALVVSDDGIDVLLAILDRAVHELVAETGVSAQVKEGSRFALPFDAVVEVVDRHRDEPFQATFDVVEGLAEGLSAVVAPIDGIAFELIISCEWVSDSAVGIDAQFGGVVPVQRDLSIAWHSGDFRNGGWAGRLVF